MLIVLTMLLLRFTVFGKYLYAVGGNIEVARLSGVPIKAVRYGVYVLCSLTAAVTGLLWLSRMGVGDPGIGDGIELQTITAVIIGGTSLIRRARQRARHAGRRACCSASQRTCWSCWALINSFKALFKGSSSSRRWRSTNKKGTSPNDCNRAGRPSVRALQPSLIRKLANAAIGRPDVIPLWFGEPDKPTPEFIRQAAKDAIDEGQTFYQPSLGIAELRAALADYTNGLYSSNFTPDNFVVAPSGMSSLSIALQCIVADGAAVVVPSPVWPNVAGAAEILGAEIVRVPIRPQAGVWTLDLDELFAACPAHTGALAINSPNNPTGWMLEDAEQRRIIDFCRERDIWLIADEVYNRIVYDRDCAPSFADKVNDDDKFLLINSFSKSWAMTGWRLGWLTAPSSLVGTLGMVGEFNFSCVFAPTQFAGITALREGEAFISASRERYRAARDLVSRSFAELPRVGFPLPRAAFYAFFTVDGVADSYSFAERVLRECSVGLTPGAAFGPQGEGYLRLCFAAEAPLLDKALTQMLPLLT